MAAIRRCRGIDIVHHKKTVVKYDFPSINRKRYISTLRTPRQIVVRELDTMLSFDDIPQQLCYFDGTYFGVVVY